LTYFKTSGGMFVCLHCVAAAQSAACLFWSGMAKLTEFFIQHKQWCGWGLIHATVKLFSAKVRLLARCPAWQFCTKCFIAFEPPDACERTTNAKHQAFQRNRRQSEQASGRWH